MTQLLIEELLENLAKAYGGHSQYGYEDIGRAIAGHINNQLWHADPDTYAREVANCLADKWNDDRWELDREAVGVAIRKALAAVSARQHRKEEPNA